MYELRFIDRDTPEWDKLWQQFAALVSENCSDECPCCGEQWQYMGTVGDRHEFRHRHHPRTHNREYVHVYDNQAEKIQQFQRTGRAPRDSMILAGDYGGAMAANGEIVSDADPGL